MLESIPHIDLNARKGDLLSHAAPFKVEGDMANAFKTAAVAKAAGRWDLSRDMSTGTLMPTGNATLKPEMPGANGTMSAMHVTGANLTGWGAALSALVAGGCPFDASG